MEASVEAAEVLAAPQPAVPCTDQSPQSQAESVPAAQAADPMEELGQRLEDILSTYSSAATLTALEPETETMEPAEAGNDVTVTKEKGKDGTLVIQSLNKLSSPDEKLEALVSKYAELAEARRSDERKVCVLQQQVSRLQKEKNLLQVEQRRGILARSQLEALCRELQRHNKTIKEETLQRCREDEEKRQEISGHFQRTLSDIQVQIEQHSNRNTKLCQENANLADKLDSLMQQYEQREEGLEKVNHHRDLQQKLAEAKLEQANALLVEAEEKHKREKEYLLREAIDKTKKCFAMKEQELAMKKKLTLYSQKFDEFQTTLAKSNDIYVSFKQEMDKMTKKMKKLEKESNVWKDRFESCNKALADMIEERSEKGKEFELFVLKIQKLEMLCRSLQEERKVLYEKIREVRSASADLPSILRETSKREEAPVPEGAANSPALVAEDLQELRELQEADPVLSQDMARLKAEQTRLQEFAASLLAPSADTDTEDDEDEADLDAEELKTKVQKTESAPAKQVEIDTATESVTVKPVPEEPVPELVSEPHPAQKVQETTLPDLATPLTTPPQEVNAQLPAETVNVTEPSTELNSEPEPEPPVETVPAEAAEVQAPEPAVPPPTEEAKQLPSDPPPVTEPTPTEPSAATAPESHATPQKVVGSSLPERPISTDTSKKQASKKKKKNSRKPS